MYQSEKNVTIDWRNVTIHISNKTRIWEHYDKNSTCCQKSKFRQKFKIVSTFQKKFFGHNFEFWTQF